MYIKIRYLASYKHQHLRYVLYSERTGIGAKLEKCPSKEATEEGGVSSIALTQDDWAGAHLLLVGDIDKE
jgi:hypothetical protein